MKNLTPKALLLALAASTSLPTLAAETKADSESLGAALKEGKGYGSLRVRYEDVDQPATDGSALTLRTLVGYKTGTYEGFSAVIEAEDVRIIGGQDEFTVGPTGFNVGSGHSVIPDPETTEIDQAYIQYKNDKLTARIGRQVITLDGHRYVGHVGWRQDWQTFDAARFTLTPAKDLSIDAIYINQRNRIFAEATDADSSDLLFNASYKTSIGKLVGYAYLLDDERTGAESDSFGVSLAGSKDNFLYNLEYATQDIDSAGGASPDYTFVELGYKVSGVTAKLGYEVLGSDSGASFTTPLATLHKFNGWTDVFLGGTFNPVAMPLGLEDTYVSLAGKLAGVALLARYHDYSTDAAGGDYGSEIEFQATKGFKNGISLGLKFASYSSDNTTLGAGTADVDKVWLWTGYKF